MLGIARSIIRSAGNVVPDLDHADTADTLEAMRDEPLVLAHAFHPHSVRTGSRTNVGMGARLVR
ncbi:hypothetical protein [Streptomyces enissocaesilis]|uniref:hypothetical protein n=1 Tax=Streptomyces enissocaesilis TaxID=332589 RepID=UPI0031DA57C4